MKKIISSLVICLAVVVACAAQTRRHQGAPAKQSNVNGSTVARAGGDKLIDSVLDKYFAALGDRRAHLSVKTRIMRGTFEVSPLSEDVPQFDGTVEIYLKEPHKALLVLNVAGKMQFLDGFDGHNGWEQLPFAVATRTDEKLGGMSKRNLDGAYDFNVREAYARLTYKGVKQTQGREAHVIEGTPKQKEVKLKDYSELLYFDRESGLLLRIDPTSPSLPHPDVPRSIVFEQYGTVESLRVPTVVRYDFPGFIMTMRIYEIKHNVLIEDALFDTPRGAKLEIEKPEP